MKLTLLCIPVGDDFRGGGVYELVNNANGIAIAVCGFEISEDEATFEIDPDPEQRAPANVDLVQSLGSLGRRLVRLPRHQVAVERLP